MARRGVRQLGVDYALFASLFAMLGFFVLLALPVGVMRNGVRDGTLLPEGKKQGESQRQIQAMQHGRHSSTMN